MSEQQRRILLTGGSGTLGHHIVKQLLCDPRNEIHLLLRHHKHEILDNGRVHLVHADLSHPTQTWKAVQATRPSILIHAAASGLRFPKPDWFRMAEFNVDSTLRLFEASCELPDCHFVHISTGLVYRERGRPLCESDPLDTMHPYGASKAGADLLIRAAAADFHRKLTVLRPFSFTGVGDAEGRLFPSLLRAASLGQPLALSPGKQIRDFCAAQDIATAVIRCLDCQDPERIKVLNLGSGLERTLQQLVEGVCKELGLRLELQFGAKPYQPHEPMHLVADICKAKKDLGWQPATNLAYCVWELACADFPSLKVEKPRSIP